MSYKCPVCGVELICENDTIEGTLMESHQRCVNNHYWYDYVTGHSELVIGQSEWSWHHTEEGPVAAVTDAAIAVAKEAWKERS